MSTEKDQGEPLRDAFRKLHEELHCDLMGPAAFEARIRQIMATSVDAECPAEKIVPPKYTVRLVGGGSKSFYHDEQSIKAAPDEEKRAWAAYRERLEELHDAERLAKEDTQEREYKERRLAELPSFEAYNKRVGISELALRLMFIEAQYLLGRALTWPTS